MSSVCTPFDKNRLVWVTEFGDLPITSGELREAGLRENPRSGWRRDKRYRVLADFLSLLALDQFLDASCPL